MDGLITESGRYCPTGLPASNTRHNPDGSERKDPSFIQLSNVPMESQMEELTTRCSLPHLPEGGIVWVEVLQWAEGLCLYPLTSVAQKAGPADPRLWACNSGTGHQGAERPSHDPDNSKGPREVLSSMGC